MLENERMEEERKARWLAQPHQACRSRDAEKLTAYQSKVDNLKQEEIVYVIYNSIVVVITLFPLFILI